MVDNSVPCFSKTILTPLYFKSVCCHVWTQIQSSGDWPLTGITIHSLQLYMSIYITTCKIHTYKYQRSSTSTKRPVRTLPKKWRHVIFLIHVLFLRNFQSGRLWRRYAIFLVLPDLEGKPLFENAPGYCPPHYIMYSWWTSPLNYWDPPFKRKPGKVSAHAHYPHSTVFQWDIWLTKLLLLELLSNCKPFNPRHKLLSAAVCEANFKSTADPGI